MNDISFERVPIDTSANVSTTPEPRHNFSKILLKNNKGKHKTAKKNRKTLSENGTKQRQNKKASSISNS